MLAELLTLRSVGVSGTRYGGQEHTWRISTDFRLVVDVGFV